MHLLYQQQLMQRQKLMQRLAQLAPAHQCRPADRIDAPTPWRTVSYLSELDEILDANGFTVAVCRPEHAARIVAAVNGVERQPNEASNGN